MHDVNVSAGKCSASRWPHRTVRLEGASLWRSSGLRSMLFSTHHVEGRIDIPCAEASQKHEDRQVMSPAFISNFQY